MMKNNRSPDPKTIVPVDGIKDVIYVKLKSENPNTIVGDFTYDTDFESQVTHYYDFNNDKLVIGEFF